METYGWKQYSSAIFTWLWNLWDQKCLVFAFPGEAFEISQAFIISHFGSVWPKSYFFAKSFSAIRVKFKNQSNRLKPMCICGYLRRNTIVVWCYWLKIKSNIQFVKHVHFTPPIKMLTRYKGRNRSVIVIIVINLWDPVLTGKHTSEYECY